MVLSRNIIERNIVHPDITDHPHHHATTLIYPKRELGKKNIVKRSFQSSWLPKWTWLHYCEDDNVVFCHTCILALSQKEMQLNRGDASFVSKGFSNCKDAMIGLKTMKPLLLIRKRFRFFIANNLLRYWWFVKQATLRHEEGQQRVFADDSIKYTLFGQTRNSLSWQWCWNRLKFYVIIEITW